MARGPRAHLKRLNAPGNWMLDKLTGKFAPRPSAGPHKMRECLPLILFVRNRLKYALTYHEVKIIVKERNIMVDGKVRTDMNYPAGFMDVITIPKTNENFRLLYDSKGRYTVHKIKEDEAKYKLGKVRKIAVGPKNIPYVVTHDGRTVRYPNPLIKVDDTVKIDLATGAVTDFIKLEPGVLVMCIGGRNMGRVGTLVHRERHLSSVDIVHVKDAVGRQFATRVTNVFVIGTGKKPFVSLPKGKGIRLTIAEERDERLAEKGVPVAA